MTRNEARVKCIEAMMAAYQQIYQPLGDPYGPILAMTTAFDALYDVAFVVPTWPDQDMVEVGYTAFEEHGDLDSAFAAMAAAGDLTNPPEKKP